MIKTAEEGKRKNMKYIALIPLLITTVCPVFAANVVNDDNKGCNVSTLLTTDGSVELIADWSINTINLAWYNNDERMNVDAASQSCKYGDVIKIPTVQPRHGYNLVGWRVRQPSAFDLSTLDATIGGNAYYAYTKVDDVRYCFDNSSNLWAAQNITCPDGDEPFKPDLVNVNDWKVEFSYGVIRGTAICSNTEGVRDNYANDMWNSLEYPGNVTWEPVTDNSGEGRGCWCNITGYAENVQGVYVSVFAPWVFWNNMNAYNCPRWCAESCAEELIKNVDFNNSFRRAMFGITVPRS